MDYFEVLFPDMSKSFSGKNLGIQKIPVCGSSADQKKNNEQTTIRISLAFTFQIVITLSLHFNNLESVRVKRF